MMQKVVIVSLRHDDIEVMPLTGKECAECTAHCDKRSQRFAVRNPRTIPLSIGQVVTVSSASVPYAREGVAALLVPLLCAGCGFFAATPAVRRVPAAAEGIRALFVLTFLFASAAIMFAINRHLKATTVPEILSADTDVHGGDSPCGEPADQSP